MDEILATLAAAGISAYGSSVTALDAYFGRKPAPLRFYLALCSLQDLARAFEGLEYPGLPYADAALEPGRGAGEGAYFRCADSLAAAEAAAFAPLDLLAEGRPGCFQDPKDAYPRLRERGLEPRPAAAELQYFEAAALLARYDYELGPAALPAPPRDFPARAQRDLLALVLTGPRPEAALGLLLETGFVAAYWPELAALSGLGQSKEYHPEGDAWAHTMETFRHRKLPSLTLSLALLLHDAGKPAAESAEGRRFDRHAEIGRALAERFLRRLGFAPALVEDVSFLVRYHMLPAALPRLPANRLEGLIDDARFPLLLELYKCDELSTFRGPDGYYEACAAYRAHLRDSRNPWGAAEGKRLARLWLEDSPRGPAPARGAPSRGPARRVGARHG